MPKLRNLSGANVLDILSLFGFQIVSQRGSHAKLRRIQNQEKQTLTIPLHQELDKGTLKAIFRQALRYVPESQLKPHFYTD